MSQIAAQLNTWLSGLGRYLSMSLAASPLTKEGFAGWVTDTFADGIAFTSLSFFLFFPVCVILYHAIPNKIKNFWLLICSYYFYYLCTINRGSAHPEFVLLLAIVTFVTWLLCLLMDKTPTALLRRLVCALAITASLGLLVWYKYVGFIGEVLHGIFPSAFAAPTGSTSVFLPIGISFYIFLSVGYIIDVYRKTVSAEKNLLDYALFVSFFPQIVSGPIARSTGLLAQLKSRTRRYDHLLLNEGLRQMLWGYFKKMVVAGNAALIADTVFASPARFNGFELFCGAMFYTLQIYADFSGYSDIAIGGAKVLGLQLGKNFDRPYFSTSIGEFWDRWHISLSSWLQDYLYIPLGGSRKGTVRACINVLIVFLLSGLWHGAAFTFVVWGGLHGIWTAASRLTRSLRQKFVLNSKIDRLVIVRPFFGWLLTFCFVSFAWIFFRAADLPTAFTFISRLPVKFWQTLTDPVACQTSLTYIGFFKNNGVALMWSTAALFGVEAISFKYPPEVLSGKLWFIFRLALIYALCLAILFFGVFGASGWVYGEF